MQEKLALAEYPVWCKAVVWRQYVCLLHFLARYFERILRVTFPIFLAVLVYLWWNEVRVQITVVDTPATLNEPGKVPVVVKYRQLGPVEWAKEVWVVVSVALHRPAFTSSPISIVISKHLLEMFLYVCLQP